MNKTIATAALSFLTLGSLSLTLSSKVEALASPSATPVISELSTTQPTTQPTTQQPVVKADVSQDKATQEIAYGTYCETYTDGYRVYSCCIDSFGNWVCVW